MSELIKRDSIYFINKSRSMVYKNNYPARLSACLCLYLEMTISLVAEHMPSSVRQWRDAVFLLLFLNCFYYGITDVIMMCGVLASSYVGVVYVLVIR